MRKTLRTGSLGLASGVACQLWFWCGFCCAQVPVEEKPSETRPAVAQEADDDIESPLQEFWVLDEDGVKQRLFNVPLKDLLRALELAEGPKRPSFTIDRMIVTGEAGPKHAKLAVEFTILASDKHWVRVPLRLAGARLAEPVKFHDEGEHGFEIDDNDECVAWFRGESETPHRLTIEVLAAVENLGGRSRLRLAAPRVTSSELLIKVPLARAVVVDELKGGVLTAQQASDGGTEIKAAGLESDFELTWHDAVERVPELLTVLEAKGQVATKIEGSSVESKAQLTVDSFGGEFPSFRVRLPHGATLVPEVHEGYTVTPASPPGEAPADVEPRLVEVRLKNKATGPIKVQLTTQQAHDVVHPNELLELGGFELLGAVRQWGHISVEVDDAWQVSFGKLQRVRQVEDLPDDMRRGEPAASFSYFGQPYSLPARIVPRATLLFVEPSYLAQVYADRIDLASTIKYHIRGAKAFALEVDFSDWEVDLAGIDSVEPAGLIDTANIVSGKGMPLTIPLKQAMKGELRLAIRARRQVPEGAEAIEFRLPRPKADTLGEADLVVVSADNVELSPRELFGLVRRDVPAATILPAHQHEPLGYRGESAAARFAAAFHVDTRRVTSQVSSTVTLATSGDGSVSQTIAYNVSHEAVDSFLLDAPRWLAEAGLIEASADGHTLPLEVVGASEAPDSDTDEDQPLQVRVMLLEKCIGRCDLLVKYKLAGRQPAQGKAQIKVPLVMPADGECLGNELNVLARPGVEVQALDPSWNVLPIARGDTAVESALRLAAPAPRSDVLLGLRFNEPGSPQPTVVERAWLQTRFGPGGRHDRAVFALTTHQKQLTVRLPRGMKIYSPVFRLDGATVSEAGASLTDQRVISLPKPGPHVLDVSYRVEPAGPRRGRWTIEVPQLDPDLEVRETYWQLSLPRDEYLLAWPTELSPESSWVFSGFHWGRMPLLEQADLETWSGLTEHSTPLAAATNRYLFSTRRIDGPLEVRSAGRSLLVLGASGVVLGCGLALIYLPLLRHPAVLLAASVGVLAAAALAPELAVLGLQAAALGGVLILLAAGLKRGTSPHRRGSPLRGASSSIVGRGSTRSHPRLAAPVVPISTETAAVGVELSAPEANA